MGLEHYRSLKKPANEEFVDEDVTTNSINASSEDESEGDSKDIMVVVLAARTSYYSRKRS